MTLSRVNQLVREAQERADPDADAPGPDPWREWAERSLGLKKDA